MVFQTFSQIEKPYFLKSEVDQLPENYGGKPEFNRFINEHLIYPKNALNNKQPTEKFRKGDFRWDTVARKINKVVYMPDPPFYRYVLEGLPNVSYPEIELIKSNEIHQKYDVDKFLKKQYINKNKTLYLVKWKGYKVKDATWEEETELRKDLGNKIFEELAKQI